MELNCKSWAEWTQAERAIFVSHLNQPDERIDKAIARYGRPDLMWLTRPLDPFTVEYLGNLAEEIGERLAIQALAIKEFKNRSVWGRKP